MVIVLSPSAVGPFGCDRPKTTYDSAATGSEYEVNADTANHGFFAEESGEPLRPSLRKLLRGLLHWRKKCPEVKSDPDPVTVSRPSMSLIEHSIAIMRTSSIRSLGKSFRKHSNVDMLDETWEDWLEQYQTGTTNLSSLSRPVCFWGFGHMAPPHHKNELARLRSVDCVSDRRIWRQERSWLDKRLRQLLGQYRLKAATVSLIEKTCQVVLHDVGLGKRFPIIGRELSLDAHTILSSDYFTLLDAGTDWRTRLNPLVHGPPFIKFYVGVPIFIDDQPVGCLALLDPYLKAQVPKELVAQLTAISHELSLRLQARVNKQKDSKQRFRVQWADDDDGESMATVASTLSGSTCASEPSSEDAELTSKTTTLDVGLHDTRISHLLGPQASRAILQPYEVFESLLRCRSIPQAIKKACRIVWQNLGSELVYIVEARLRRKVFASAASLHNLRSGTALRNVADIKETTESNYGPRVRLVGYYGPQLGFDAEPEIIANEEHFRITIASKYGIKYNVPEESSSLLRSGVLMPFRRKPERITWDEKALAMGLDSIPCNVWSDGFVMGASVSHERDFSPGDVMFMKKVVRAVENILTCRDEQKSTKQ